MPPQASSRKSPAPGSIRDLLGALGSEIGAREAEHAAALGRAFSEARRLHALLADAVEAFHVALEAAGSAEIRITLGEPRLDEKHVRAVQFELLRGRTVALIVVKSRGDVTLVGPFQSGKTEGPCQSVPFAEPAAVEAALADFVARFIEQATAP